MSIDNVTARIAVIQSQLAAMAPVGPASAGGVLGNAGAVEAADFAQALQRATSAVATSQSGASAGARGPAATTAAAASTNGGGTSDLAASVIEKAKSYLGMPYVWGGDSPSDGGMDCSGLVQHVYGSVGIDLPRVSADQARSGTAVGSMAEARPGDLIAWDNSSRNNGADHIAIYLGNGKMLHAPYTGSVIKIEDVSTPPDYIRRVLPETSPVARTSAAGAVPAAAASAGGPVAFERLFAVAEQRYGVDAGLLSAIARAESSYAPRAVSPAGAQGLMQLMPATARSLGVTDSFDPAQAVDGAARLMRELLDRFDGRTELALAGYNAGPGAVLRYGGVPPYPETQGYVQKIMSWMEAA
ncbi:transglycosylase SLT domain-containing protein [Nocardioides bruguierae]|uniref:Transglycosylase SLT domain-containing protein n=1 Tax=Nocardioides bruguierae TaxID=2945102 RepID=A0A9X2DBZ0_9ACTN|nr:transglycosylase SLT domain-containing protein [Nocardioides bruguierae]MCM0622562.1 transglycosylase SLT domain-containing protein [Nocardioides bruguierae]